MVACDASVVGIIASLLQEGPRRLMPIACASKLLFIYRASLFSDKA